MSEFERESINLQKRTLKIKEDEISSKKEETLATAKPLKKLVMDKCAELEEELDQTTSSQLQTGDDQFVTKTMLKLADWKVKMESIRSTYLAADHDCSAQIARN